MSNLDKYLNPYEFTVTLPISKKKIKIKPLNTNGMKKLLVYENEIDPIETEVVLDTLLETFIVDDINVYDLYIQDRYFLFVELRKISKGTNYTFTMTCPHCKSQSMQNIDLNNLKIKEYVPENVDWNMTILDGALNVEMGFFTRAEQFNAHQEINPNLSDTEKQVEMSIIDLALSMKKITNNRGEEEGVTFKEKVDFVGKIPESQYDIIKEWIDNNYYGYEMNVDITCPHCNELIQNYNIPLDNFLA